MVRRETRAQKITRLVFNRFPLLSRRMEMEMVDIQQLILFVLAKRNELDRAQRLKIGDDVRDYVNTSDFLRPLSNKALREIGRLKPRELRCFLIDVAYPFSRLSKKTREILLHLPNSWIHGAADCLLNVRRVR